MSNIYANTQTTAKSITTPLSPPPHAELLPVLDGIEAQVLIEDIQHNGLRFPIWLFEGKILDGRNRYAACRVAGVEPRFVEYEGNDPLGFVISANLHRRHLSLKERKTLITTLLVWRPELSNRQIAKMTDTDKNTVGTLRGRLESTGEIPQLTETVGADGRKRSAKPHRSNKPAKPIRKLIDQEFAKELIAAQGERDAGWFARFLSELDLTGNNWDRVVEHIRRPEPTSEGLPLDDDAEPPTTTPARPVPSRWS